MRLTAILLLTVSLHAAAGSNAQTVTLNVRKTSLQKIFTSLIRQTGFSIVYDEALLATAKPVTIRVTNASLESVLTELLQGQPFSFSLKGSVVTVQRIALAVSPAPASPGPAITSPRDQRVPITGVVRSMDGKPLDGATISITGISKNTVSVSGGHFTIDAKAGDIIVISYVGFESQTIRITEKMVQQGTMGVWEISPKASEMDNVMVVAYGKTTQKANTGSVTVIKGEQVHNLPNLSVDRSLQGLVPGLLVTQGSGQPGGGPSNFVVRGISTGGDASNASSVRNPLFIIDGVPVQQDPAQGITSSIAINNPMAQLNPSDIESITVLKDAAAISLYGSKASNGVILVTTKRGTSGKTTVSFRHQTDIATRLSGTAKPLNRDQYLELYFEAYRNTNPGATDAAILASLRARFPYQVKSPGDTAFYAEPNWLDELYTHSALTLSNNLSISGGSSKSNYYLNLEYTKQDGVQKNTGYDRKSLTFNYENRPADWIKLGLKTTMSYNVQDFGSGGSSETLIMGISPLNSIRDNKGDLILNYTWGMSGSSDLESGGYPSANPLAAAKMNINRNVSYRGLTNMSGEIRFLKDFTWSSNFGVNFMLTETKQTTHPLLVGSSASLGSGKVFGNSLRNANLIATNILRYDRVLAKQHSVNILVGHEAQSLADDYKYIQRVNTSANPLEDQLRSGQIDMAEGEERKQRLLSYFGQLNYGFRNRYFFTASARTDGSSLFGDHKKFGAHWSTGLGWVVSDEKFFKPIATIINYFKLRGSIGSSGNSSAINGTIRYDNVALYYYAGNPAIIPNFPGNPEIQWESTFSWNGGLELGALKNRISMVIDLYIKKTTDLIGSKSIPWGTGFSELPANIGDLTNTGLEITLNAKMIKGRFFNWNINTNWSSNKNRLNNASVLLRQVAGKIANGVGENYNSFYLPVWAGVNPADGRPQWFDENAKPTSDYESAAYRFVGKPQPDGFGAFTNTFNYKGIELSAMFYYQYGFKTYNDDAAKFIVNDGSNPFINQTTTALDRWQKTGDMAANPRRLLYADAAGNRDMGNSVSTRYLFDGDFLRLSNLQLAYHVNPEWLGKYRLNSLRLFVQGHNLAGWTKYSGGDPENISASGSGAANYPIQRSYSIGLNLTF